VPIEKINAIEITIEITDLSERTIVYEVYDKYVVDPSDVNCTSQRTNGMKEITIITCTDDSKQRVIVKARERN
jgi:sortase (surface protein transpeptidase)